VLSVIGVIYGALAAIKQTDLKYINAYSSVSHLGMVLFALLMNAQHLLPNALMVPEVRLAHFIETASSNFVWGIVIVWLLDKRGIGHSFQPKPNKLAAA
jgi:NADH:ubiquinone oxidoreductase subunit 4 (subunit M)